MDHAKSSIWLTWELHPDPSNCQAVASAVRKTMNKLNRSEEHTSELQSRSDLVCRLLLEKKKNKADKLFTDPAAYLTVAPDQRASRDHDHHLPRRADEHASQLQQQLQHASGLLVATEPID